MNTLCDKHRQNRHVDIQGKEHATVPETETARPSEESQPENREASKSSASRVKEKSSQAAAALNQKIDDFEQRVAGKANELAQKVKNVFRHEKSSPTEATEGQRAQQDTAVHTETQQVQEPSSYDAQARSEPGHDVPQTQIDQPKVATL
ncbi:hypothetical protein BZG36_02204 [Bifiguratus adelaidae]|uniref:Uncharacterized protein n=1 Tax=Bifiguratus adelaidae TaxID=1938954 RepID=A0A261Y3H6_9FUNG|nr:hypothetical protein BZG36_02204 [Bifiguratus adelaidae]